MFSKGHVDDIVVITIAHHINTPLPRQLNSRNDLFHLIQNGLNALMVTLVQNIFVYLVDNVIMAFLWAGDFLELILHNVTAPIGTHAKDFLRVKVHKHAIFGMKRQAIVDGGIVFLILDILSDNPLIGGVCAVETAVIRGSCHRASQMI